MAPPAVGCEEGDTKEGAMARSDPVPWGWLSSMPHWALLIWVTVPEVVWQPVVTPWGCSTRVVWLWGSMGHPRVLGHPRQVLL